LNVAASDVSSDSSARAAEPTGTLPFKPGGMATEGTSVGRKTPRDRIPAAVRRAIWLRDKGRCQWPLESGGICGSTYQVEID
jgi:hypothetical protein